MTTKTVARVLDYGEKATTKLGVAQVRADEDELDRAQVNANGIVVDVIANDDGTVYIECYPYEARVSEGVRRQVIVGHAAIDRYTVQSPNLRLGLVEVTK